MAGTFRKMYMDFWKDPIVLEEMTPEDKFFTVYLLTNPFTTQIGIYKITKKQIAFDMGLSVESIGSLMDRFIHHHKLIRYNPETRELALKNWGKNNLDNNGKPFMDCIFSELNKVEDTTLIQYIAESIRKKEIRDLFQSFCEKQEFGLDQENDSYINGKKDEFDDTSTMRYPVRGQEKEEEKEVEREDVVEKEKETCHFNRVNPLEKEEAKEIVAFWDNNGFGFANVNAKEQLLAWLDDSKFLKPKEMILKAMNLACANNKKSLSYIFTILRNWENQSLLTVEEIDDHESQRTKNKQSTGTIRYGRDIPTGFVLDLTAGEEEEC